MDPQGELTNLNYVDLQYRNVHLKYNQKDQSTFFESLHCYKSQFTSKDIDLWIMAEKKILPIPCILENFP